MVKASEFVSNDPLLSFVQNAGVNSASVSTVQDRTDAFADLRHGDRRCPFFFPAGQQNPVHRKVIEAAAKSHPPYDQLPTAFKTVIPNAAAIAEATEPGLAPHTFNAKYTSQFSKLYKSLCEEIVQRCERQSQGNAPRKRVAAASRK